MKVHNKKFRSIGVFALVLVLLVSTVLPMTVSGSSPDDSMAVYIVKQGDTLSSISAAHGVTVSAIVNANGISASADLYVGQRLTIPGATAVDQDTTTMYANSRTISFTFKDADVKGAIETVLAHTGYTMICKNLTDTKITFSMDDVTPMTAIDYILRMADMTYIKNDNIIYVGSADTLNSNFIDSKALTRVVLKYISSDTLISQLGALGISVQVIKSDINLREFWISGYPMQLAKAYELIQTLDNAKNITTSSASISTYLSAIEMDYLTAGEFSSLLSSLGLHAGITMAAHPMTLYVYATGDAYNDIMKIKQLVDIYDENTDKDAGAADNTGDGTDVPDTDNTDNTDDTGTPSDGTGTGDTTTPPDVVITDGETTLVKLELQYITKQDASSIINTFGYDVEMLGLDMYEKIVWLRGASEVIDEAVARIKECDVADNDASKTMFEYELKNIVASELQSKVAFVKLQGVDFYFGSYPTITKSIMVYCSKNKVDEVKDMLNKLDNNLGKIYYPIAEIQGEGNDPELVAREQLVVKFINNPSITVDVFQVSDPLSSTEATITDEFGNPQQVNIANRILYVYESPENVDLIIDMWGRIGA